jgi:hypothetical protein
MKANGRLLNQQAVLRGCLYFLWHPGTRKIFSGYGLTTQAGHPDHLVGLLMVDRPRMVDPVWLAEVEARFGGYELYVMTVTGERGIACQMQIEPASLPYLRRNLPEYLGATVRQAFRQVLNPLLQSLPKPRLQVRWDERLRLWTSQFQEPPNPKKALFQLGQVVATPGAMAALQEAGQQPEEFLYRHVTGDWGELDEHDRQENERAVKEGNRVFSAYQTNQGVKIWVITEWDRSVTTLLLPSEY